MTLTQIIPTISAARRILVIDDNLAIHDDFRKVLGTRQTAHDDLAAMEALLFDAPAATRGQSSGFELDAATQGAEGLAMVEASLAAGDPYQLAFVDIRMPPGWDGVETIERLWRVDPSLQIVICSAYSDYSGSDIRRRLGHTDGLLMLRKPFDPTEVTQLAHALTAKWALQQAERERAERLEQIVRSRTAELEHTNALLADEMARREKMENELRLAQKLEAIGQLASGIAHEINTPTQYVNDNVHFLRDACRHLDEVRERMRTLCDAAREAPLPAEALDELALLEEDVDLDFLRQRMPRAFDAALDGLGRIAKIVLAMKEFGHHDQGQKTAVDLNRAITTTLEVARNEYKYVADVETELGDLPLVTCLGSELNQVFLNLLVNAAHAIADVVGDSGDHGAIRITTRVIDDDVRVSIADTGKGIPETIRRRVFDPFFTTKEVGKGTGQGLAIARSVVVDKHGGKLWFDSEVGVGTTFHIQIPIESEGGAS